MSLETPELKILIYLLLPGPARKSDIVKATSLTYQQLSTKLTWLENNGLVVKQAVFFPRPGYIYMISRKGVEELRKLANTLNNVLKSKHIKP